MKNKSAKITIFIVIYGYILAYPEYKNFVPRVIIKKNNSENYWAKNKSIVETKKNIRDFEKLDRTTKKGRAKKMDMRYYRMAYQSFNENRLKTAYTYIKKEMEIVKTYQGIPVFRWFPEVYINTIRILLQYGKGNETVVNNFFQKKPWYHKFKKIKTGNYIARHAMSGEFQPDPSNKEPFEYDGFILFTLNKKGTYDFTHVKILGIQSTRTKMTINGQQIIFVTNWRGKPYLVHKFNIFPNIRLAYSWRASNK